MQKNLKNLNTEEFTNQNESTDYMMVNEQQDENNALSQRESTYNNNVSEYDHDELVNDVDNDSQFLENSQLIKTVLENPNYIDEQMLYPKNEETFNSTRAATTKVSGSPRKKPIVLEHLKNPHYKSAPSEYNYNYILQEGNIMYKNRTSSTIFSSNRLDQSFANIEVVPFIYDFGVISCGERYRLIGHISNKGLKRTRFRLQQPKIDEQHNNSKNELYLNMFYKTGLIAPGNKTKLELELYCKESFYLETTLIITSELQKFEIPIKANIIDKEHYNIKKYPLKQRVRKIIKTATLTSNNINNTGTNVSFTFPQPPTVDNTLVKTIDSTI